MKAKTNMEGKYIKKCAEVSVAQTQKRCNMSEKQLKDEIEVSACVLLFIHRVLNCFKYLQHYSYIFQQPSPVNVKEFLVVERVK